jgi:hypothetical protein
VTASEEFLFSLVDDIQRRENERGLASLTSREQVFFLVWSLEAEVNNGGFNQFFFNSAGDYASETIEALRTIGAERTASLTKQACDVFGSTFPSPIRTERQDQVAAPSESQNATLWQLDKAFFAYPDNLSKLLALYMAQA